MFTVPFLMTPLEATPLMTVAAGGVGVGSVGVGPVVEELEEWPQAVRKSRDIIANALYIFIINPPIFYFSFTPMRDEG
jgi:hypothetical protein